MSHREMREEIRNLERLAWETPDFGEQVQLQDELRCKRALLRDLLVHDEPPERDDEHMLLAVMTRKALDGTYGTLAKMNAEVWLRGSRSAGRGTEGLVNPISERPIKSKALPGVKNPDRPSLHEMRLLARVMTCVPGRMSG